jgi:hypothetical protein
MDPDFGSEGVHRSGVRAPEHESPGYGLILVGQLQEQAATVHSIDQGCYHQCHQYANEDPEWLMHSSARETAWWVAVIIS